jgi:hypothetical protein
MFFATFFHHGLPVGVRKLRNWLWNEAGGEKGGVKMVISAGSENGSAANRSVRCVGGLIPG